MKKLALVLALALVFPLAACSAPSNGSGQKNDPAVMDLTAVYTEMENTVGLPEMLLLDGDKQLDYYGIEPSSVKQAIVSICADSLKADEIWLLEASDSSACSDLKKLAQSRIDRRAEESRTYSPEQYAVVQKAKILTVGNYMALIISPDVDSLSQVFLDAGK